MESCFVDVPGYENLYSVSRNGEVFSKRSGRLVKQSPNKAGYMVVSTKIGGRQGKCIALRVHRMVAMAFIENPEMKPEVNHIDGNKKNNGAENLEWCTSSENKTHAYDSGLRIFPVGEGHPGSKLTDQMVAEARRRYKPNCRVDGAAAMARKFGVHPDTLGSVLRGERWNHT